MKKRHNIASHEPIPFDLVIEILTRVPAKSIARFRCLSKLHASTLCTPNFTDSFFTISSSRPRLLFTVLKDGKTFFFSSPQPQHPSPVTADSHMCFSINCPSEFSRPVSGLVCGLNRQKLKGRVVTVPLICNPSTWQSLTLPRVKTRRRKVISYVGYDPSERQFKILCMTYVMGFSCNEHQVLTLGTGKKPSWRMIKCDLPHCPLYVNYTDGQCVYDRICINGVLYYSAFVNVNNNRSPAIVCFDVRSEKFSFIKKGPQGRDIYYRQMVEPALINYKGKLAKLQPNTNNVGEYTGIQLWVLEDAEKHEWSSYIYVLPSFWKNIVATTRLCFVGTTGSGEIVLSPSNTSNSFYLLYYNPEANTISKAGIQGMEDFQSCKAYTFFDHVENVKLMARV